MKSDIEKFIEELENLENGNRSEALMITGKLPWQAQHKLRLNSKADAYRFVIRQAKKRFKKYLTPQAGDKK